MKNKKYSTSSETYSRFLSGEIIPYFEYCDYNLPENQRKLESTTQERKKILERKIVNWPKLNEFKITI